VDGFRYFVVMVRSITSEELETYHNQGVVKLPGLVSRESAAEMLAAIDEQLAEPSRWLLTGTHLSDRCFGLSRPALRSYLLDPDQGENAARAMKSPSARFYFDHVFVFAPQSPVAEHYWHQDVPYWPVEGEHIVSIWLSLVPCTPETAALKFVPGSHRAQKFYRPNGFDGKPLEHDAGERGALAIDATDQFVDYPPPPFHEDPEAHGVLEFSYEPGDAVMFHSRVVHSSGGNNSPDQRRVAYSARYIGEDVRLTLRQGVFQDPALLPDEDEPFAIGGPMRSRRWPVVHSG
jgi:ectoine hydroxylase-related dioxygenase (phytanoyl-CoA dioxygenase family)